MALTIDSIYYLARFAIHTLVVPYDTVNHVHHILRAVLGLVSVWVLIGCHYYHTCASRDDTRVDLLEMKTYGEIDPDKAPIVVLGCGHFFTAETLNGLMGMGEVYLVDGNGKFTGLKDVSAELSRLIPRCPDCQRPVRQYATQ
ncbi:uncharacterized protein K444DRAFT_636304 [Hyaloscypha bicolor E]|uniref:Uncharacterized protein n=1 Tax=Hyaloscypha bicolor E TaxID=1095630 RepID=A0A2J6SNV1_9HELO|nr:uncharacterized protein K444DRAFT_636304 [Hyaloscypha bicolor E]PMD52451.1 hypothetical protein K444DRAFT_636304 [Hyaloscypha bicolor E]